MISLEATEWYFSGSKDFRENAIERMEEAVNNLRSLLNNEATERTPFPFRAWIAANNCALLVVAAIRLAETCEFDLEAAVTSLQQALAVKRQAHDDRQEAEFWGK